MLKVGDRVKIIKNPSGEKYINEALVYVGETATITDYNERTGLFTLDVDGGKWGWTREVLEPPEEQPMYVAVSGDTIDELVDKMNEYAKDGYAVINSDVIFDKQEHYSNWYNWAIMERR